MPKIYLFRTIKDGSRDRLRPMPYQTSDNGRALITDLNVQADAQIRKSYPLGTVFASELLIEKTNGTTPFYSAGDIYPVSVPASSLLEASHRPTEEMMRAYTADMAANADRVTPAQNAQGGVFADGATAGKPLSLLDKLQRNPKFEIPTVEKDGFWVEEDTWWNLVVNLVQCVNTCFKGPAGSGKTSIVRLACERLGLKLHTYDMGSMYDPISDLLGVHRMTAQGSVFDFAQFTQDIQEEGVILLDELSRAVPDVNNLLLPCLDDRRTLRVEMAGSKDQREIPVHPKCRFVVTANIGAQYVGAHELDIALADRFDFMSTTYMPSDKEVALLVKNFKIPRADASNIVSTARNVREIAEKGELSVPLTTRETIRAAQKVQAGFPVQKAMTLAFLDRYEGTRTEGDKAIVLNAILAN